MVNLTVLCACRRQDKDNISRICAPTIDAIAKRNSDNTFLDTSLYYLQQRMNHRHGMTKNIVIRFFIPLTPKYSLAFIS